MANDDYRYQLIARAITIAQILSSESLTLDELAARLGLCQRSARRLVKALQAAGVDIEARPDGKAGDFEGDEFAGRPGRRRIYYRLDRRAWLGLLDLPA